MRKELVIILVLLFGGALVAYNWFGGSPLAPFFARGTLNVNNSTPPPEPVGPPASQRKTPSAKSSARPAEKTAAAQESAKTAAAPAPPATSAVPENSPVPVCCPNPDFPFPTPQTLRVGSTMTEIRAEFGKPAVDIAGTREGHVVERYYYVNKERNLLSIANIENGRLVSAESLTNPYFQLPGPDKPEIQPPAK